MSRYFFDIIIFIVNVCLLDFKPNAQKFYCIEGMLEAFYAYQFSGS